MEKEHFDTEAFFAALDGARETRGKTWKDVAAESGVSASTLTRMAQGKRPDLDGMAALLAWSGMKAEQFIKASSSRPTKKPETLAVISTLLRADKKLGKESATALDEIIRVAYRRLAEKD
jgi:transcriptional regulator with XRE-family HTH domain